VLVRFLNHRDLVIDIQSRRQTVPSGAARSAFLSGFASGPLEYLINLASFCQNAI
jgi:hypothetical protein